MHIKIHIPPTRETGDRWRFPDLCRPTKSFTVPIKSLSMQQYTYKYTLSELDEGTRKYADEEYETERYWVKSASISNEWKEIHAEEYKRISGAMSKLNLAEVKLHNKVAVLEEQPGKTINPADMNALFGLEVGPELVE